MSREAKIFTEKRPLIEKRIKDYECFGWELLSISGEEVAMSRETQNKVYPELVKLEFEYELLREQRDKLEKPVKPEPFSIMLFILTFMVLIVPGIIYIIMCVNNEKVYKEDIVKYEEELERITLQINRLVQTAKVNFFGRMTSRE